MDFTGTGFADVALSKNLTVKDCWDRLMQAGSIKDDRIQVIFTGLTKTQSLHVSVRIVLTASECLKKLVEIGFLPTLRAGNTYAFELERSGAVIEPAQALEQAGVTTEE